MINIQSLIYGLIAALIAPVLYAEAPTKTLLPEQFKVYYKDNYPPVSKKVIKGADEKTLPTHNEFTGKPGCYLGCVTKTKSEGVYSIGDEHYLVGQIRVKGYYHDNMCLPVGYDGKDLRTDKDLKTKCETTFPEKCTNASCKINNHTANWFY